jgi:hypothetical protein
MRLTRTALTTALGGFAALTIAAGCGQSPQAAGAGPSVRVGPEAVAAGPTFGVLQVRALHYIIDRSEKRGHALSSDVTVYNDGRIVVTADMNGAGGNPRGWISVRLSDLAGRTIWTNEWTARFCTTPPCASSRKATWTFRTSPGVTARAANLWLKLDIR